MRQLICTIIFSHLAGIIHVVQSWSASVLFTPLIKNPSLEYLYISQAGLKYSEEYFLLLLLLLLDQFYHWFGTCIELKTKRTHADIDATTISYLLTMKFISFKASCRFHNDG